jgi:RND family efflux transporter MFP subunit
MPLNSILRPNLQAPILRFLTVLPALFLVACSDTEERSSDRPVVAVEVAEVTQGPISLVRTFSGQLEANSSFTVSPKVAARVRTIKVDIGDVVVPGQLLAELDSAEFELAVLEASAEVSVAKANLAQAKQSLEIARKTTTRAETLFKRGVSSEAELDASNNALLAIESDVAVYKAQLDRSEASLDSAEIQLAYTDVRAEWEGERSERLVSARYIDEGQMVTMSNALLEIVDVKVLSGVFFVTEKDYARLQLMQKVELTTDAYPGQVFEATIARIAPVFQASSRQARIELHVPNTDALLKPGMFVQARVEVASEANAFIVPESAVVRRSDQIGIFLVDTGENENIRASWRPVQTGIREGGRVQVIGANLSGRVITLGQQQVEDGARVKIVKTDR